MNTVPSLIEVLGVESLMLGYDMFRELFSSRFPCAEQDGSLGEAR